MASADASLSKMPWIYVPQTFPEKAPSSFFFAADTVCDPGDSSGIFFQDTLSHMDLITLNLCAGKRCEHLKALQNVPLLLSLSSFRQIPSPLGAGPFPSWNLRFQHHEDHLMSPQASDNRRRRQRSACLWKLPLRLPPPFRFSRIQIRSPMVFFRSRKNDHIRRMEISRVLHITQGNSGILSKGLKSVKLRSLVYGSPQYQ